jgi:hypothetical protein
MGIPKILAKVVPSVKKFNNFMLNPKNERLFNEGLPLLSSAVCTGSYIYATAHDKKIPKERKPILQIQNVVNGVIGILISAKLNQWAYKKTEKVIQNLQPKLIKDYETVIHGTRIAVPIAITSLVMRLLVSSGSVLISDVIKRNNKKLDKMG